MTDPKTKTKEQRLAGLGDLSGHSALAKGWLSVMDDEYRFVPELARERAGIGGWRRWTETGWVDGNDRAQITMSTVAETCWVDKRGKADPERAGSFATTSGALKFAAATVPLPLSHWDANDLLLGLADGTLLDLASGEIRNARHSDFVTRKVDAVIRRSKSGVTEGYAGSPVQAFIQEKLPDPALRQWVQRWCGYCLSGITREQIMVWIVGDTSTGKSTLRAMLQAVLGDHHFGLANDLLRYEGISRGTEKGYALEQCHGRRLITVTEWGEDWKLDESFFTSITGCDTVYGRRVRGVPVNFLPRFKLMVFANYTPAGRITPQVLRRLVPVPMEESHDDAVSVDRMDELTAPESRGHFLEWCLDGWRSYRQHGLRPLPPVCIEIRRQLTAQSIVRGDDRELERRYAKSFTRVDDSHRLPVTQVHAIMLDGLGASTKEGRRITRWMAQQHPVVRVHGTRLYTGIRFISDT